MLHKHFTDESMKKEKATSQTKQSATVSNICRKCCSALGL